MLSSKCTVTTSNLRGIITSSHYYEGAKHGVMADSLKLSELEAPFPKVNGHIVDAHCICTTVMYDGSNTSKLKAQHLHLF